MNDTVTASVNPNNISLLTPQDAGNQGGEGSGSEQATGRVPRDSGFDTMIAGFDRQYTENLMNGSLSISQYSDQDAAVEKEELNALKVWLESEKSKNLSEGQREELGSRLQNLEYNQANRDLQAAYEANPNDPEIKAQYEAREAEFKDYRERLYASEDFGSNEHILKIKALDEKLDNTTDPEKQAKIKNEMSEEMREFKRELAFDPQGKEKTLNFIETNSDNKVIQDSGMLACARATRAKDAEMGIRPQARNAEDLENAEVTPNGAANAGAVDGTGEAKGAAETEVAAANDNGKDGKIDRVQLEGGVDARGDAQAQQVPDARDPNKQQEAAAGL